MHRDQLATEHWNLQGSNAQVAARALRGELDVERPMDGLRELQLATEKVDGSLLAVDVGHEASRQSWQLTEVYARGSDLVAAYREPAGQRFNLQIYWRVLPAKRREAAVLEAIVSIHTREWEAYPRIALESSPKSVQAWRHERGVGFLSSSDWAYVEVSPPGDFDASLTDATGTVASPTLWTFGPTFMERGVIRRLRLRGAFVPLASAEDEIERMSSELAVEAPPLTA